MSHALPSPLLAPLPPPVAFPPYAVQGQPPPLAGSTALLFQRGAPGAGLAVSQWTVPGDSWSDLQPSTSLDLTVAAAGAQPGGAAYAAVQLPGFQQQLPYYGADWPVGFMPLLFAAGNATGGGAPPGQPSMVGSLAIPYSSNDVQNVVWGDATSAAAFVGRPAAALALALAAAVLCVAI